MKNALELQVLGIKCDNKNCDYKNENVKFGEFEEWLNKPCPKCGENLLTEADFRTTKFLLKITNFLNKILPKSKEDDEKVVMNIEMDGTGKIDFNLDKNRESKHFQNCNNCEFASRVDGCCDWHMNSGFKEGDPVYCETLESEV